VTNQNVTYFAAGSVVSQTFTGALLWDVLSSVGIVLDPNVKNDILTKIIVVTGSDGYQATFGAGEIAPNFGGNQILVAYAVDGQPLGSAGLARIVAPGDKQGGRFVSSIVKIEVETAH
jgi:Oxidoreductase molybdopterin binding domain